MTSRVEHRLVARQDNADERLAPLGFELGLIGRETRRAVEEKYRRVAEGVLALQSQRFQGQTGEAWLRRPELTLEDVEALGLTMPTLSFEEREAVVVRVKYAGYIERAERQLASEEGARGLSLAGVDFTSIDALSNEAREKLARSRPATLAHAARVPGVRHADISALLIHLRRV